LPHDGLFRGGGLEQLGPQFEAVVTVGAFSFVTSLIVWLAIDKVVGLRVAPEHEIRGLDLAEMGMEAYPGGAALASVEEPGPSAVIATSEPASTA
jgi:Amt family ammonium transporter